MAQTLSEGFRRGLMAALGVLFLISGGVKLRFPYEFLHDVYGYELVSAEVGVFVAALLPSLEVVVGAALIMDVCTGGALLASAALCLVFSVAQSTALARGLSISCGCFTAATPVSYYTLTRSVLMGVASLAAIALYVRLRKAAPAVRDQRAVEALERPSERVPSAY